MVTTTSADGTIIVYSGTLQEIIDAMEAAGINDFRMVQFAVTSDTHYAFTLARG